LENALVEPDFLEQFLISPEDEQISLEKELLKQQAVDLIKELIRTHLTVKQRQIIEMCLYENKTRQEIAETLGSNQQVVSKQVKKLCKGFLLDSTIRCAVYGR
jgi:RNA polymerase sigma factor (sigma-70 family)